MRFLAFFLLLSGCASDGDKANPRVSGPAEPPPAGSGEDAAASVSLEAGDSCESPCTFRAAAAGEGVVSVAYDADGYPLGAATSAEDGFALTYDFSTLGERLITATGLDADGAPLASDARAVTVLEGGLTLLAGAECTDPCTFQVSGSPRIAEVVYSADGYPLGSSTSAEDGFALTYDFSTLGEREITAAGYDSAGAVVGADSAAVEVLSDLPVVPYFYQYANAYYPSSSCQNTSAAMVLASFGWAGVPDDITAEWGKDYAQTPANLASMFNAIAADSGISARMRAHTDGTLDEVRALLDRGLPVIVHGYFTSAGHVLVILGYDADGYWVNDPAGRWSEEFMGSYPGGYDAAAGEGVYYEKAAFEAAVATWEGWTPAPMWYHELY